MLVDKKGKGSSLGLNKNTLKQRLNEYDLVLLDSRLNLQKCAKELGGGMSIFMRKRHFAFPVKIHDSKMIENIKDTVLFSSHVLIGGSKEFTLPVSKIGQTKEGIKNTMQALLKVVCLVIFA